MRMSCNGCRVLRKGCNENCTIRPCLRWIKTADSQANATVFLAKFYGRAGLMNLIDAAPDHLRPAVFRSLLYEACGRIVNPIYGSVGLLWSGNWGHCQTAVEAVLNGVPITQFVSDHNQLDEANNGPPLKAYDIRHRSKIDDHVGVGTDDHLHRVRTRCRFKKSERKKRSASHESSLSHQSEVEMYDVVEERTETKGSTTQGEEMVDLGLTLGLGYSYHQTSVIRRVHDVSPKLKDVCNSMSDFGGETCRTELGLGL